MKKKIYNAVFVIYAIIAVFVTICLLSYNEYKVTEFGNYSFIIVTDDTLNPDYNNGDLVIANKKDKVEVGENLFFYNVQGKNVDISIGKTISKEEITNTETTYTLDRERQVSSEYVLGSANDSTKIPAIGMVLNILESKWGFLFLIVFPSLLAFIYEITVVVSEIRASIKNKGQESNDEKNKDKK